MCKMLCEHGFAKGEDGCDTCECLPPKCPKVLCGCNPMEGVYTALGTDENGCETCSCEQCPVFDACMPGYDTVEEKPDENGCPMFSCVEKKPEPPKPEPVEHRLTWKFNMNPASGTARKG